MPAATNGKPPVLVVVQLGGGNDFMNTLIPYTSNVYYDSRPKVNIAQEDVLPMNDLYGWHPKMGLFKDMFDAGDVAVIQGIGYPNSSRSHFRAQDIWHTCEPDKISTEGWLGKVIRELDPKGENPLTGVNFGRGLSRSLALSGVPVTSIGSLDNYGLMTGLSDKQERVQALTTFKDMYSQAIGTGPVMDYLAQTGLDVLRGAEELKKAPQLYKSNVEYADNPIAQSLRDAARVHLADLGARILYTQQGGYDVHANENPTQPKLLGDLAGAIHDFWDDLRQHDAADNVIMMIWTEFGRRIKDNGSGTDHGSGGGAFLIGDRVNGGLYSEYPSIDPSDWLNGEDMIHTYDYRGFYSTILDQWMKVEPKPVVNGSYEQLQGIFN
jgi:uncharacterized protein (DUF1501 family)